MCGIVAAIALDSIPSVQVRGYQYRCKVAEEIERGLATINHRGPDTQGQWISRDNRVAFGHVRLSIKDLSEAGDQPLHDVKNEVHAIVNGEIYDYDRLRQELSKDYVFRNESDSELVIALYHAHGVNLFSHLRGEFSFCLYDERRQLFLAARDRFGVKPLFWTIDSGRLLIASEIKALKAFGWQPHWDVRSILEEGWLHDERTLFKGVKKLRPAWYMTCLSFDYISHLPYWEASFPDKFVKEPRTEQEMIEELRERLYEAVSMRMQSDVPIGLYLSGGIDSSAIAGIAADMVEKKRAQSNKAALTGRGTDIVENGMNGEHKKTARELTCFSIGFDAATEFDEMGIAERTAAHLNLPFIAQRMDEQTFADNFEAAYIHSEHHNMDLNTVAKFILSKLAHDHGIKAVLSGEGSDEHFGGYAWLYPDFLREPDLTYGSDPLTPGERDRRTLELERQNTPIFQGAPQHQPTTNGGAPNLARRMLNNTLCPWTITSAPFAAWAKQEFGATSIPETRASLPGAKILERINKTWHPLHTAQYIFTHSVLSNYILTCLGDRMEMAHSVEGRPPFLDHYLTQFANSLPPSVKVAMDSETGEFSEKWILKEAARPYLMREMYERKKHPFLAPFKFAAGGPMHVLLKRLVTRENVEMLGFVDVEETLAALESAFTPVPEGDPAKIRPVFIVAQWVTLSRAFGVPAAAAEGLLSGCVNGNGVV